MPMLGIVSKLAPAFFHIFADFIAVVNVIVFGVVVVD